MNVKTKFHDNPLVSISCLGVLSRNKDVNLTVVLGLISYDYHKKQTQDTLKQHKKMILCTKIIVYLLFK